MQRSETKSTAAHQQIIEDVDTIIPKILAKKRCITTKNLDTEKCSNQTKVFTKEQEIALKKHIVKCCQSQYYKNTTIRKMIYEYAQKLPDCQYPKRWDTIKMASVDWFIKFRSRHPGLKKTLTQKRGHCVCIAGCHMGPEGKQALKDLEAEVLIARVYHYLKKEYEYMTMCNDLSLLMNILRRTAEATGVCEQTITKILEEKEQNRFELSDVSAQSKSNASDDIPVVPKKKKTAVTKEKEQNRLELSDVSAQSKSDASDDIPVVPKKKKIAVTKEKEQNRLELSDVSAQSKSDASDDIPVVPKKKKTAVTKEKEQNRLELSDVSAQSKSDASDDVPVVPKKKKTAVTKEKEQNRLELSDVSAQSKSDASDDVPVVPKKKITAVTKEKEISYNCSGESSNIETVDEDSSSSNNVLYSDFERLQQNATSIRSVVVEILDEDFNEKDLSQNKEDTAMKRNSKGLKHSNPDTCATKDQPALMNFDNLTTFIDPRSDDQEDEGKLVIDESQMIVVGNDTNITRFLPDNEVTTKDLPRNAEDTSMRINSTGLKYNKPITLKHGNPADAHTIPSKKRLYPWRPTMAI